MKVACFVCNQPASYFWMAAEFYACESHKETVLRFLSGQDLFYLLERVLS